MPQLGALFLGVLEQVVGQLVGIGVRLEEYLERGA